MEAQNLQRNSTGSKPSGPPLHVSHSPEGTSSVMIFAAGKFNQSAVMKVAKLYKHDSQFHIDWNRHDKEKHILHDIQMKDDQDGKENVVKIANSSGELSSDGKFLTIFMVMEGLHSDLANAVFDDGRNHLLLDPYFIHIVLQGAGFLASNGISAGERRVGASLKRVAPYYHRNRMQGIQNQLNPVAYFAPNFGYNLHLDQNEKLVDYGVCFVIAVDGKSAYVAKFGLWECIVCDHGKEFFLTEFIQHYLSPFRITVGQQSQRDPYKQLPSTQNNRVERLWGEVNPRVGFPLKYAFIDMEQRYLADRSIGHHLFAMSQVGIAVAEVGLQLFINSWNFHPIPVSGVPNSYIGGRMNFPLPAGALPDPQSAINHYQSSGGTLTDESAVGEDLLSGYPALQNQRNQQIENYVRQTFQAMSQVFGSVSNHVYWPIQNIISYHIHVSETTYNSIP